MARETQRNVAGIAARVAVMLVAVVVLVPLLVRDGERLNAPGPTFASQPPIAQEADVFRTHPEALAVAPAAAATAPARPRTLRSTRALRAYPGAPPRIPHELAEDEFRDAACANCHAKGGFVARFEAYTPLTPHPEYESCLQCHAVEQATSLFVSTDWQTVPWPVLGGRAMEGSPLWIPHDLQLRGNCLACHGGPGAVEEIRTTHPERANCRQCHVPAGGGEADDVFIRPLDGGAGEPREGGP